MKQVVMFEDAPLSFAARPDFPSDLRALTLWRPWDQAIVHGFKRLENRSRKPWASIVGQVIAIHAGLKYDDDGAEEMAERGLFSAPLDEHSPRGCIVGIARVTGFVTESDSPWFIGPYGWTLDDVVALKTPVPCKGAQGFWVVPGEVAAKVFAQVT